MSRHPRGPRVALIATGGTIASTRRSDGSIQATLPGSDLLNRLQDAGGVHVDPILDVAQVNSWNVDPHLMVTIAESVRSVTVLSEVDGVVVTHGTDTLEETAFVVDILNASQKPVVFTAAMRNTDADDPDGPQNLAASLLVASSPELRGFGTVVCLDHDVHAARWVRKSHTSSVNAFVSPEGPIARIGADGTIQRLHAPLPRWELPGLKPPIDVRTDDVIVVQPYTGMAASALRVLMEETKARGLVIDGFGLGHIPGSLVHPIRELVTAGTIVVIATRVPNGGVSASYGGLGGGKDLEDIGVISARALSAAKARLLLLACLDRGQHEIAKAMFTTAISALDPVENRRLSQLRERAAPPATRIARFDLPHVPKWPAP